MILVYSNTISPRLQYILQEILFNRLGYSFECTDDLNTFIKFDQCKINYSHQPIKNSFQIEPHGLLTQQEWCELPELTIQTDQHWHYTFFQTNKGNISFDIFSASFYLLSRYEEYHAPEMSFDNHQRFKHSHSIAFKHGFLELPLVDIWCKALNTALSIVAAPESARTFRFISTIDIDFAYRYKGYGIYKQLMKLGKALTRLRLNDCRTQIASMLGFIPDPYDTYSYIENICQKYHVRLIYFILMRNGSRFDKNISPVNTYMKLLLKRLNLTAELGIHPSYFAANNPSTIEDEKTCAEKIIKHPISYSRQHYLRFQVPDTFQSLIKTGISNDYSMGYAEHVGFRAGTCMPFQFFDLTQNQTTSLTLHPISVMDTTMRYAMKLKPEDARKKLEQLMVSVKNVNGEFISVWHNSNLGNEEGWFEWKDIFEYMHTLAAEK